MVNNKFVSYILKKVMYLYLNVLTYVVTIKADDPIKSICIRRLYKIDFAKIMRFFVEKLNKKSKSYLTICEVKDDIELKRIVNAKRIIIYGIYKKDSLVGICGFDLYRWNTLSLFIVIDDSYHRQAIGSSVIASLIQFCDTLGFHALLRISKDNVKSIGMAKKIGLEMISEDKGMFYYGN